MKHLQQLALDQVLTHVRYNCTAMLVRLDLVPIVIHTGPRLTICVRLDLVPTVFHAGPRLNISISGHECRSMRARLTIDLDLRHRRAWLTG